MQQIIFTVISPGHRASLYWVLSCASTWGLFGILACLCSAVSPEVALPRGVCEGVRAPLSEVTNRGRRRSRIELRPALRKALQPGACGSAWRARETPARGHFPGRCWKESLALGSGRVSWRITVQFAVETALGTPSRSPLPSGPCPACAAVGEASVHPRPPSLRVGACRGRCACVPSLRMGRPVCSPQIHRQQRNESYFRLSKEGR